MILQHHVSNVISGTILMELHVLLVRPSLIAYPATPQRIVCNAFRDFIKMAVEDVINAHKIVLIVLIAQFVHNAITPFT